MNVTSLGRALLAHPVPLDQHVAGTFAYLLHTCAPSLNRFCKRDENIIVKEVGGGNCTALPTCYDTVSEYFERTNPEAYALLFNPLEDLKEDEIWMDEQANLLGLPVVIRGDARAYPRFLLAKRLD